MRFTPKSEQEIEQERQERMALLKVGRGTFTVLGGESRRKEDPELGEIEYHLLTLDVFDSEGNNRQLTNVCLHPKMMELVRQFCYATGLENEYEMGSLEVSDCLGKSGDCEIGIEKGNPNPKGGTYADKNKIKSFVVAKAAPRQAAAPSVSAAATESARKGAFAAFKAANPGDPVAQNTQFKTAFTAYFGNRETTAVRADEWKKFQANGFVKHAVASPVSEDQQFKDDDIPF